jgi:hypothetical protein
VCNRYQMRNGSLVQATSAEPKRWEQLFLLFVLLIGIGTVCGGCATMALPPRLSSAENARLRDAHLPLTIGVERFEYPAYSDDLVKGLRRVALFDGVDRLERFTTPPALIARVKRTIYGEPIIPILWMLSIGVIPESTKEEWGYSFYLSPPGESSQKVAIEYSYRGRTTLGWIALLDGLLPGRTFISPKKSRQFRGRLAIAILDNAAEIKAIGQ